MVTVAQDGNRRVIVAVDDAARRLNLRVGMTAAHAQTLVSDLHIEDARPEDDEAALARLGLWATRYSPLVTTSVPDGLFIDVAGSAHIFKGETALRADLINRLAKAGFTARATISDTPGCAWAVSRFGEAQCVPQGRASDALGGLPVAALRLSSAIIESLHDVGIERIAQLASKPRGALQTRFGLKVLLRLDQALGVAAEPLVSLVLPEVPRVTLKFIDPVSDPTDLRRIIARLCEDLMEDLTLKGLGARRLDLIFLRVDNVAQAVRIGASMPSRDSKHLGKLLCERLVLVDPGFGIEEASLIASWVEALTERQVVGAHVARPGENVDIAGLVDTLSVRLGPDRIFRLAPVESDVPERVMKRIAASSKAGGTSWPDDLPRPARLFTPPELVSAVAQIPDSPPRFFVWRKIRHRVVKADGPERILGEWWRADNEIGRQRDYYRVEDQSGERFWLFRDAPVEEGGRWFLHGVGEA